MAYEVGSQMKETLAEHRAGDHNGYLDSMCTLCSEVSDRLVQECLDGRHDGSPRPLCWICGLDAAPDEVEDYRTQIKAQEALEDRLQEQAEVDCE